MYYKFGEKQNMEKTFVKFSVATQIVFEFESNQMIQFAQKTVFSETWLKQKWLTSLRLVGSIEMRLSRQPLHASRFSG